ncbi:PH-domain-containing protein [Linnemannia elongata AG-77]|uniref:PH-domain-containing protein n=1 Tax=Linnemannia elongata AG-77 TaxID=1314771 RepID=A0A197K2F7_9FUNG|nr:PH-domain-containing protein [Linnemannia elongata AG-77]
MPATSQLHAAHILPAVAEESSSSQQKFTPPHFAAPQDSNTSVQPTKTAVTFDLHSQTSPSSPPPPSQQQQQQADTISPGVTFSDDQYEQYDSDMEPELDLGVSRETLHEGQVLKAGFLHKKGERIKIWKKKWFVLRTSKLAYYKDSKEYELLRIIDIRDIHKAAEIVVKNKTGVFVIVTPRRTFTVQADSAAEMEQWVNAINQAKIQHEFASGSDMDSYSGSTPQLDHPSSAPQSGSAIAAGKRPELVKQGSGTLLPPRQTTLSLSDPGFVNSGENPTRAGRNMSPPTSSLLSRNEPKLSGLSLGIMSQSLGQLPSSASSGPHHPSGPTVGSNRILQQQQSPHRTADGLSLITSGANAIRIGGSPVSPPRDEGLQTDLAPNSLSSNFSFNTSPKTPTSPEYGSGGEQFGHGEHNVSSEEEEDIGDDPTVLEAGRVAAAANAPGSGLVTGEQLDSKVVRQGYLLKLGNTYKTWRKKWFVLRGDKLTYYKNTKEYQPLGIIPLSSIIDALQTDPVSKHKQYCLRIVTAKRSFVCCAPDEDTLLLWLDAIHVECERVAQESRRELDGEDLLSDPRAMGRVAHMNAAQGGAGTAPGLGGAVPRSGSRSVLAPAAVSSSIQSTGSQLKKMLSQESGGETGGGNGLSVSFSTSPAVGGPILAPHAAGGNLSSSFATSPSRSYHTPEGHVRPTTVTFST